MVKILILEKGIRLGEGVGGGVGSGVLKMGLALTESSILSIYITMYILPLSYTRYSAKNSKRYRKKGIMPVPPESHQMHRIITRV
jgi:hypothetical protein